MVDKIVNGVNDQNVRSFAAWAFTHRSYAQAKAANSPQIKAFANTASTAIASDSEGERHEWPPLVRHQYDSSGREVFEGNRSSRFLTLPDKFITPMPRLLRAPNSEREFLLKH